MRYVLLIILALTLIPFPAGANYWSVSNSGMSAWSFSDVVMNPTSPQILYAAGMIGVYKSTNGGSTWTAIHNGLAPTPYSYCIKMHPTDPNTLYVVSQFAEGGRGVYKTTDGGASWVRKSSGIHLPYLNSIVIFQADPQILFAGTNVGGASGGVFKSTNGGDSWSLVAGDEIPSSRMGNDAAPIVVDPVDSNYVFCGKNSYTGFARSTNGGSVWTWVDYSFVIKDLLIHPGDTNRVFAGGTGYLKISKDRGQTLSSTGINESVGAIAVAPSNPEIVYAGPLGGTVRRSTNRGDTWSKVGSESHEFNAFAIHPTDHNTLYAATNGEGMLKSTNGGVTWSAINGGLPTQMRCTKMVSSLTYKAVFAIIDNRAMYASYDGGASWNQLIALSGYPGDLEIWGGDDKTLYMAHGDIFKSTDLGLTWIAMNTLPGHALTKVAVDPNDINRMFVFSDTDKKVRRSTDGGATWQVVTTITGHLPHWDNKSVSDIVIDPSNSQRIYLGTLNHPWKSEDGGNTWTILLGLEYNVWYNGVLKPTSFIRGIALDPVYPNIVYATTQWGGTWRSTNYGNTWSLVYTHIDANVHNNVIFDPRDRNIIYISTTSYGVFKSINGGSTWTQLISGLSGADTNIYVAAMSPWNYDQILGGSYAAGIYRGGGGPDIPTLADAKGELPDGGIYAFTSPMVVSSVMPDGAIYVQSQDRSQGIRVLEADGLQPGDLVSVKGTMGTQSGERYISAIEVAKSGSIDAPEPMGMTNRAVGGTSSGARHPQIAGSVGTCNTGLLVSVWGEVTAIADDTHFYIDDGSGLTDGSGHRGVRVESPYVPGVGQRVVVTGASGACTVGTSTARLIRVRDAADIIPAGN